MNLEKKKYYFSFAFFWIVGSIFLVLYFVYFLFPLISPSSEKQAGTSSTRPETSMGEETSVQGNDINNLVAGLYRIDKIVTTTDAIWLGILADQGSLMSKKAYDIWKKDGYELILWYEEDWSDLTDHQFEWSVDSDGQLSTLLSQGGLEGNARLTRTLKDPLGNVLLTSIQLQDNHDIELFKGEGGEKSYRFRLEFSGNEFQFFDGGTGTCINGNSKVTLEKMVVEVRERSAIDSVLDRQEVKIQEPNTVPCATNVFPDAYVPNPIGLLEFVNTKTIRFGLPNGQTVIADVASFPFAITIE